MEKIKIRQATRDDAPAIHELHIKSVWELCKGHYSNDQLHRWLDIRTPENFFWAIDRNILFVAIEDSVIVGFGGAVPGKVWATYVLPSHIKSGIGSMLLSHAMEIALIDNSKVTVVSTLNAVGFYGKRGFVEVEKTIHGPGTIDLPSILMEYKPSN